MKSLTEYITEKQTKSPFDEIIEFAYSWIDYMYNEGVVDYNDDALLKLVDRKAKPDYKDFCQGMLHEFKKDLGDKTIKALEDYLKSGKGTQVESAINAAIDKFCSDANIG